ncbi:hypothetical protein MVES_001730 [Malassezia vespertilionis]|uniref:Uncharacterized protein n=1 Tax=Malassezia vespertilionis TaxID=2020962 RepID=A0A2N1JDB3_9BASI|nr:hypothetical protein MVES_001730 [Malassezia vespertilionis]
MGRAAKLCKKPSSAKRRSTSDPKRHIEAPLQDAPRAPQAPSAARKSGMRAKARRAANGPLPAEAGIDYVRLWEGKRSMY